MDKYTVKINPKTFRDLNSIFEYIAHKKLSPENALGQIRRIKTAILGLNYFPQAHQERLEGRFARLRCRRSRFCGHLCSLPCFYFSQPFIRLQPATCQVALAIQVHRDWRSLALPIPYLLG